MTINAVRLFSVRASAKIGFLGLLFLTMAQSKSLAWGPVGHRTERGVLRLALTRKVLPHGQIEEPARFAQQDFLQNFDVAARWANAADGSPCGRGGPGRGACA